MTLVNSSYGLQSARKLQREYATCFLRRIGRTGDKRRKETDGGGGICRKVEALHFLFSLSDIIHSADGNRKQKKRSIYKYGTVDSFKFENCVQREGLNEVLRQHAN